MPFGFWEIKRKGSLPKAGIIIMSLVAGLFLGIDFTAWNYSIFYVGAGIAAILLNLQVIVVPMLAAIFDKYKIPPVSCCSPRSSSLGRCSVRSRPCCSSRVSP